MTVLEGIVLYLLQAPLKKTEKTILKVFIFFLESCLIILLAYLLIAYASPFMWHTGYLFGAMYLALLGDVCTKIICLLIRPKKQRAWLTAFITMALFLYGTLNMQFITPSYHNFVSVKLKNSYRLVFLSDLHYGSSQSENTVKKAFEKIRSEDADYLLLGGDIVDEHTTFQEMKEIFSMIADIGLDTYYIYGNHDRQERADYLDGADYSPEQLQETIIANGITILYNNYVQVAEDLVLLGMEDPSHPEERIRINDLGERPADTYVICLDHTPYQNDDIAAMKADLQLSGHTHAGQLFPLRTIYSLIGLNTYGDYRIADTDLFVSSGISGWFLPLRNEAHCNYEVIDLKPE